MVVLLGHKREIKQLKGDAKMNATQARYAVAVAAKETIGDVLFSLERDWTDAENAAYVAATREWRAACDAMIEWALGAMKIAKPSEYAQIKDLPALCAKNLTHFKRLAEICYRFSA